MALHRLPSAYLPCMSSRSSILLVSKSLRCLAVVKELLRITPIVPALFRRALKDFELGGRLIPKVKVLSTEIYTHS